MSSAFVSGPPPLPESALATRKRFYVVISIVLLVCVILFVSGYFVIRYVVATGITRTVDNQFGDQHLKTAVALIELHKVRYGRYPDSLRDLRFTGSWDAIALIVSAIIQARTGMHITSRWSADGWVSQVS
jgi:predicted PurR-regulated permease PerM